MHLMFVSSAEMLHTTRLTLLHKHVIYILPLPSSSSTYSLCYFYLITTVRNQLQYMR
jgi:hypothetical protein